MNKKRTLGLVGLVLVLLLAACDGAVLNSNSDSDALTAAGAIAADDVKVASELGGRVSRIEVLEGDQVQAGDVLFELDDELARVQYEQALAAVEVARAAVDAALAQRDAAQAQYDLAGQGARFQDRERRQVAWTVVPPEEIDLPGWYFVKDEQIVAARALVDEAAGALAIAQSNLDTELANASNDDFVSAETRLAEAQVAFQIAGLTLMQADNAVGDEALRSAAQETYDTALAELESAQLEYDRMLSSRAAENILEARAKMAVAQAQADNAGDALDGLLSGEQSLQVEAARAAVVQAEMAINQAEAGLAQAEAAVAVLEVQLAKTVVTAPAGGIILSLNLAAGELVAPGGTVMTIGQLDTLNLTVYVPEDRYGQVKLGQAVEVSVDSFPGDTFSGEVKFISDQAEFTPRNVQTVEGRKSTVYAVKISVPNTAGRLKPGMPADVTF